VVQFGGDLHARIQKRIKADQAGETISDTRAAILNDASCYYEALLAQGRGADAQAILDTTLTAYPIGRTYNAFIKRMIRLEMFDQARALADVGREKLDGRGEKQIEMALRKIPTRHGGPTGDAVLPEHVRERYERQEREKEERKRERAKRAGGGG